MRTVHSSLGCCAGSMPNIIECVDLQGLDEKWHKIPLLQFRTDRWESPSFSLFIPSLITSVPQLQNWLKPYSTEILLQLLAPPWLITCLHRIGCDISAASCLFGIVCLPHDSTFSLLTPGLCILQWDLVVLAGYFYPWFQTIPLTSQAQQSQIVTGVDVPLEKLSEHPESSIKSHWCLPALGKGQVCQSPCSTGSG